MPPSAGHDWLGSVRDRIGQLRPRRAGTPEEAWRAWPGLDELPVLDTPLAHAVAHRGRAPSVLVVGAHPDDEVLGFGGTMALLAASGVRLRVVSVTDGEASHPRSRTVVARNMAAVRARELHSALACLGATDVRSKRLGVPDTMVSRYEGDVTDQLSGLLDDCSLCVAPFSGDRHPDHDAAGRAALAAGALRGVRVWEYPVWAWHWAAPGDAGLPWHRATRIPLLAAVAAGKRAALECFTSQIRPLGDQVADKAVLPPGILAYFQRDFEVVLR